MNDEELLTRYSPRLRYDSQGSFAADSPAIVTDRGAPRPNVLRADGSSILAEGGAGQTGLNIDFLRSGNYLTGAPARKSDYLDEVGRDYIEQARAMHLPQYRDRVHGHIAEEDGERWLQYWFFYYYNDKAFLGVGLHEGDWEMVQLRLTASDEPVEMTFAQHTHGQRCAWSDVEKDDSHPIVYVARGSQASYPSPGLHDAPLVKDRADGLGADVLPAVVVIASDSPGWVAWPGRWGSTKAGTFLESDSPRGPAFHKQWKHPRAFDKDARKVDPSGISLAAVPIPPAPEIEVSRVGDRAVVRYRVERQPDEPAPTSLTVSVYGHGDGLPPATYTYELADDEGQQDHPLPLAEGISYEVRASTADMNGVSSSMVSRELPE